MSVLLDWTSCPTESPHVTATSSNYDLETVLPTDAHTTSTTSASLQSLGLTRFQQLLFEKLQAEAQASSERQASEHSDCDKYLVKENFLFPGLQTSSHSNGTPVEPVCSVLEDSSELQPAIQTYQASASSDSPRKSLVPAEDISVTVESDWVPLSLSSSTPSLSNTSSASGFSASSASVQSLLDSLTIMTGQESNGQSGPSQYASDYLAKIADGRPSYDNAFLAQQHDNGAAAYQNTGLPAYKPQAQQSAYFQQMMALKLAQASSETSPYGVAQRQSQQQQAAHSTDRDLMSSTSGAGSKAMGLPEIPSYPYPTTMAPSNNQWSFNHVLPSSWSPLYTLTDGSNDPNAFSAPASSSSLNAWENPAAFGMQPGSSSTNPTFSMYPSSHMSFSAASSSSLPAAFGWAHGAGEQSPQSAGDFAAAAASVHSGSDRLWDPRSQDQMFASNSNQMPQQGGSFSTPTTSGFHHMFSSLSESKKRKLELDTTSDGSRPSSVRSAPTAGSSVKENRIPVDQIRTSKDTPSKKAVLACHFCRGRKLKCDGAQPCIHCARRSIECCYDTTVRRRGPGKVKREDKPKLKKATSTAEQSDDADSKPKSKRGRKPKSTTATEAADD